MREGDVLGRWTLERELGRGGLATVYAAHDARGERAAVKVLRPEFQEEPSAVERFLREAYLTSRVDHPDAVRVFEASGRGEQAFVVMELLEGESLETRAQRGPIPVGQLLEYADRVLDVLAVAHAQGIIHRDLKPSNLFVTGDHCVKVLDFGIARLIDDVSPHLRTQTGVTLGTLPYMAPEQAVGRHSEIDGRTDLFSLGATLFRLLSGRHVHETSSSTELVIAMATQPAPPLASVAPHVAPEVCAIVDTALAFFKHARYPDARAMQRDLRQVLAGQAPDYATAISSASGAVPAPIQTAAPVVRARGSRWLAFSVLGGASGAIVAFFVIVIGLALLYYYQTKMTGGSPATPSEPNTPVGIEELTQDPKRTRDVWRGQRIETVGRVARTDPTSLFVNKDGGKSAVLIFCAPKDRAIAEHLKPGDPLRLAGRVDGVARSDDLIVLSDCEILSATASE